MSNAALRRLAYQLCRKRTIVGEGYFRRYRSDQAPILYDQWYEGCGVEWEDAEPHWVNFCERWLASGVPRNLIVKAYGYGIHELGVRAKDKMKTFKSTGAVEISESWIKQYITKNGTGEKKREEGRGRKSKAY